jgi:hypothetical protein
MGSVARLKLAALVAVTLVTFFVVSGVMADSYCSGCDPTTTVDASRSCSPGGVTAACGGGYCSIPAAVAKKGNKCVRFYNWELACSWLCPTGTCNGGGGCTISPNPEINVCGP